MHLLSEASLLENDKITRAILETVGALVVVLNSDGKIVFFNRTCQEVTGYSEAEVLGRTPWDFLLPDDVCAQVKEVFGKLTAGDFPSAHENAWLTKDRQKRIISWSNTVTLNEVGAIQYVVGTGIDITERVHAESTLKKSEREVRTILETMTDVFYRTDHDGCITMLSDSVQTVLGYSVDELISQPLADLYVDPKERDDFLQKLKGDGGRVSDYAVRLRHKNGQEVWVSTSAKMLYDAAGAYAGVEGTTRNITARKKVENALLDMQSKLEDRVEARTRELKESEARSRKLTRALEQSPSAVFITDTAGIIEFVNSRFTKLTGYTAEEALGQNPRIIKSQETPRAIHCDIWTTIQAGQEWRGELQDTRKDGSQFWAYATIAPIKDDTGHNTHYVATHEDISARKAAELAVRNALNEAEVASRTKSELMANMSHELRTPLNAIIGFSSLMETETFGPLGHEKYREYLSDIHSSGQHLLDLINDILDVSAIEAGMLTLHENVVQVGGIVESSVRLVNHRAQESQVHLHIQCEDNLPMIFADERRMKQVLLNLLTNSIKFTPAGGDIYLTTLCDEADCHVWTVKDTGIGMNEAEIKLAMAQFGQVDSTLSRKHEGTGLGLPLTRGLVELHDGMLSVESQKGKGTTIQVRFPPERTVSLDF
ncbi:PAS domain S-box protein [Magnetovibrio blakemorei]|uniref:histidine kinase n=1 Tax=Magnetovibrio blakemorei TaxID=28181 RepID=A0A1E5Q388_9PROT|nr:PAS domain S-box protein [Magnetovibrio blakemorei]OEJ64075.1 hypothetical protein BEN30_01335 [Magnetovibrio blakemorei]